MNQPTKQHSKPAARDPRERVIRFVVPVICGGQTLSIVERRERSTVDFLCDDEARRVWIFAEGVAGVRNVSWTPYENVAFVTCEPEVTALIPKPA